MSFAIFTPAPASVMQVPLSPLVPAVAVSAALRFASAKEVAALSPESVKG